MDDNKEPYHFSPAYDPDDIILEGSDAEETTEETLAKRARYEAQAESYRDGNIPFIMSASMRGPFDRTSGWENPWRYRPRSPLKPTKEDDCWKPGSKDMIFTRKNVLKRAADHGLGWMTPSAALGWCKAAASAEVEAGGDKTGYMGTGFDSEDVSHGEILTGTQLSTGTNEQSRQATSIQDQLSTNASERPRQALSSQGQISTGGNEQPRQMEMCTDPGPSTISTGRSKDSFTRGTKRPHDSKWLKGSYISKRGRWDDGHPILSPTPLPALRRKDTVLKPTLSTPIHVPQKVTSISQRFSLQPQRTNERGATGSVKISGKQVRESSMQGKIEDKLLSTKSSHISSQSIHHKDEGLEEPQDNFSAISFCYGSIANSDASGKASKKDNLVSSNSESEDPKRDIPQEQQTKMPSFPTTSQPYVVSTSDQSPVGDFSLVEGADSLEEVSFITEIVPSCRDLEKFQFRKKKRIFQQNTDSSGLCTSGRKAKFKSPSEQRSIVGSSVKVSSPVENFDDYEEEEEEWETTIGRTGCTDNHSQPLLDIPKSSRRESHTTLLCASSSHPAEFDEDDGNEEWETTIGDRENPTPSSHAVEFDEDDGNEEWETTIGERIHLGSTKLESVVKSPNKDESMERELPTGPLPATKESITPPKSQYSNSSWDMVDDITTSSFRQIAVAPLGNSHSPKNRPERLATPLPVLTREIASASKITTPKTASLRQSPRQSSSSINKPPRSSVNKISSPVQRNSKASRLEVTTSNTFKADETIDQNDISTQSANTTPTRSLKAPKSPSSRHYISQNLGNVITEDASVGLEIRDEELLDVTTIDDRQLPQNEAQIEEDDENEMSQIQLALSQNCSSTSSQESVLSWGHSGRGDSDQEENVKITRTAKGPVRSQDSDNSGMDSPPKAQDTKPSHISFVEKPIAGNISPHPIAISTPTRSDTAVVEVTRRKSATPSTPHESWRASGPQTPWADDNVLPPVISTEATEHIESQAETMYKEDDGPSETNWEQFERSLLAQNDKITPLKAFITPLRSPKLRKVEANKTRDIEEDATINSWTSSLKKTGTKKFKKRVSFGFDLAEEEIESFRPPSPIIEFSTHGNSSQPDPDPLDDGHKPPRPIPIVSSSSVTQRIFKRILPDKTASQLNSSPAPIEAMAEAFIVADQEAPMKRRQSTPLQSRTQSPQIYRSSPWGDDSNAILRFPDMGALHDMAPVSDFMRDFDIAGAIGDANAFLEDWSVEADLKKSREEETKGHESNGMKRRKLFGIV